MQEPHPPLGPDVSCALCVEQSARLADVPGQVCGSFGKSTLVTLNVDVLAEGTSPHTRSLPGCRTSCKEASCQEGGMVPADTVIERQAISICHGRGGSWKAPCSRRPHPWAAADDVHGPRATPVSSTVAHCACERSHARMDSTLWRLQITMPNGAAAHASAYLQGCLAARPQHYWSRQNSDHPKPPVECHGRNNCIAPDKRASAVTM